MSSASSAGVRAPVSMCQQLVDGEVLRQCVNTCWSEVLRQVNTCWA